MDETFRNCLKTSSSTPFTRGDSLSESAGFISQGVQIKKWKTKLIRLKSRLPPPPSQAINNETDRSLSTFEVKCTIFFMYRYVKEKLVKIKERQIIPISVSSFLHSSKKFSNVINYRQPDLSSKR